MATSSKDFSLYHQLAEGNLIYDRNQKAYFLSDQFSPLIMRGTVEEYIQLIEAGRLLGQSVVLPIIPNGMGVEFLETPERKLNFQVLRGVHRAIREKRRLQVRYQSLSGKPRQLILDPHTLVFNGFRWHIRAYSHQHQAFRDFVLTRFISAPVLAESSEHFAENDQDWIRFETLVIAPHPDSRAARQADIADNFGMTEGTLHLHMRRAMRPYYLRWLQLDESSTNPETHQIVWLNREQSEMTSPAAHYD